VPESKSDKPVALVTGGSRGIGYGICEKLAEEGYNLAVCGRRKGGDVMPGLRALETAGAELLYIQADIGNAADRVKLIAGIRGHFGRLDVLVNNAGMAPRVRQDILEATEDIYEEVMRVNLQGPYFLTQAAARWMTEEAAESEEPRRLSIIFITSISSTVASPSRGEYCISKAGLSMAASLWTVRLAEYGICVNEIRPGIIATDMTSAVKDKYDKLIGDGLTLQPRWGTPEDVGKAVASLVRGDWGYSTGQAIYVDGGMTVGRL
jgi:NAD(P)-dependent dehydrogenase (short-subunit alcohol dehydrogenase family)